MERNISLVEFNHIFYIVEAQTKTFYIMQISGRHSVEFRKNSFLMFLADSYAVIRDFNNDGFFVIPCRNNYMFKAIILLTT